MGNRLSIFAPRPNPGSSGAKKSLPDYFEFLWYSKTTGVSSMVAQPLSQTNYTGIPSKIYHFNRQKLCSSSKTGYPGCTDNPTRHNRVKKDWSGAPFSVTFQSRPAGLPDKKLSVHRPIPLRSRSIRLHNVIGVMYTDVYTDEVVATYVVVHPSKSRSSLELLTWNWHPKVVNPGKKISIR